VDYQLAQVNIARLRAPVNSPLLADFVAALEPVNAAADAARAPARCGSRRADPRPGGLGMSGLSAQGLPGPGTGRALAA